MPNFKYSELWLQLHLDARDFLVLEQSKFWAASIGQWFLQNMAHATIFSLVGKILLLGGLVRYAGYLQSRRYHISEAKRWLFLSYKVVVRSSNIPYSTPIECPWGHYVACTKY